MMFFEHCAQTLKRKKLKLVTFDFNLWSIKKSYFWFIGLSGVIIATSLSWSTRDFLKVLFHIFPYNEFYKFSKVASDLIFETS